MCFGCSKEPSHRDGFFEHSQHMFWLRNKKNNFQAHLSGGLMNYVELCCLMVSATVVPTKSDSDIFFV